MKLIVLLKRGFLFAAAFSLASTIGILTSDLAQGHSCIEFGINFWISLDISLFFSAFSFIIIAVDIYRDKIK